MRTHLLTLSLCCVIAIGCAKPCPPPLPSAPVCHQFHAPGFDWTTVRRILLVPLANDSSYPRATLEFQETLAARLQCAGRFEVVLASPDTQIACRDAVRTNGRFDEAELIELAEDYHADAIAFGTITQYQPYAPPRVGLSLRLVSPRDAAVISSVDGLWDARDKSVTEQARCYTALTLNDDQSLLTCDITSGSPILFRRFACHYAVEALVNPVQYPMMESQPVQTASATGSPNPTSPPQQSPQTNPAQSGPTTTFPPPLPPASSEPSPLPAASSESSPPQPASPLALPALPIDLSQDDNATE